MWEPKQTKSEFAVPDSNLTLDSCADCKIPLLIEKEEKEQGRKVRCTACFMKSKVLQALEQ